MFSISGGMFSDLSAVKYAASGADIDIVLGADVELNAPVTISSGRTITLDLNGKTISQTKIQTEAYSMIRNDGTLTIMDSGSNGKISYTDSGVGGEYVSDAIMNTGTLIVNSGTIESLSNETVATNGYPHAIDNMQGTLTINGGTVSNNEYSAIRIWCDTSGPSDVIINGGTINGAVDLHNTSNNPNIGSLTITDGTFNQTANVNVLRLVNFGTDLSGITATISGGTFNGGIGIANYVDAENPEAVFSISGGTFNSDPTAYLASGFAANESDGVWVVT